MRNIAEERERRVAIEERKAGVREAHYRLDDGFVDVWVSFYPKVQWWIADADLRGERLTRTTRKLTDDVKKRLEDWL